MVLTKIALLLNANNLGTVHDCNTCAIKIEGWSGQREHDEL